MLSGKVILISICDNLNHPKIEREKDIEILRVQFHDIDDSCRFLDDNKYTFFDKNIANQILEFLDKHISKNVQIVCQCDAGICRSSGLAAALHMIIDFDGYIIFDDKRYVPNMLVYNETLQTFIENINKFEFVNIKNLSKLDKFLESKEPII